MDNLLSFFKKIHLFQWSVIILLKALFFPSQIFAVANPIKEAVKNRIEKTKPELSQPELELKVGAEPPVPLAPQSFDGVQGQIQEPFAPDDKEKLKMAQEEEKRRLKYELAERKKMQGEKKLSTVVRVSETKKKTVGKVDSSLKKERKPAEFVKRKKMKIQKNKRKKSNL